MPRLLTVGCVRGCRVRMSESWWLNPGPSRHTHTPLGVQDKKMADIFLKTDYRPMNLSGPSKASRMHQPGGPDWSYQVNLMVHFHTSPLTDSQYGPIHDTRHTDKN